MLVEENNGVQKYQSRMFQECEWKLAQKIDAPHLFCKPLTFFFVNSPMYGLKKF
jgi:hypothetical protein